MNQELIDCIVSLGKFTCATIPAGFLLGCIPMLIGAVFAGIANIFKRV